MRFLLFLPLLLLLTGCFGTHPYTQRDLQQVKVAYAQILPVYTAFKQAYFRGGRQGILRQYAIEQRDCRLVDEIDKRDTIDPNVNLFQVSISLDNMCNAIEGVYAFWAKAHHRPYPKDIIPIDPGDTFVGTDKELKKVPNQLRHPAALA